MAPKEWPSWWEWPLELSPHLVRRMADRRFTEVDLREMLEEAAAYRESEVSGRWVVKTRVGSVEWDVVVEPDEVERTLVVVTAYPVER